MKVIAFLPVKNSSSRIKNKNLKLLDGKPLFLHTLEKLMDCDFIDEVYLDTESDEVIELASEVNCKVLKRAPALASNTVDGNRLFLNEVKHIDSDIYIQILGTSPFIEKGTIKQGIEAIKNKAFDSAVLIRKEKFYTWSKGRPNYDIDNIPNSSDLDNSVIETMGLYIIKKDATLETKRRIGNNPFFLEASALESVDVNWPEDFELASLIAAGKRERQRKLLNNIKNHLTSSILSDISDELGIHGVLEGYNLNIGDQKIFGKAKTLKLRLLKDGESFKGIYDSLYSYESIVPNDIIVVQNDANNFAYFGEINANLAIRSGASAAIINGATRDYSAVKKIGFPVFSKNHSCRDVKKRAALESYNKAISIDGVVIKTDDLVFGDSDGIVIVPKKYEHAVLKRAFEIIKTENNILIDIAHGVDISTLVKRYGFF